MSDVIVVDSGDVMVISEEVESLVSVDVPEQFVISQGEQGPPGVDGIDADVYVHTQASASAEWTINHNLGVIPGITLFSVGGAEIEAEILHISVNQAKVYFAIPVAGSARCI